MSEEDMQRTLVAEFPFIGIDIDRDGNVTSQYNGGYSDFSQTGTAIYVCETNIDLSGYALESKTFFPYSSFEQRASEVLANFGDDTSPRNIQDIIIVSSIPIELTLISLSQIMLQLPGFSNFSILGGNQYKINRDPLLHQHKLVFSHDSTTSTIGGSSVYRITSDISAGSLEPTAADKLYCYRIITSSAKDGGVFMPAARVLIPGTITTEPTLEYMMRLKRSYELANQV